jgi:hypothetical protein
MMNEQERRRAQREFVSETLVDILHEIHQRLEAGEITEEQARREVLTEGDRAIRAMPKPEPEKALPATLRRQTGRR